MSVDILVDSSFFKGNNNWEDIWAGVRGLDISPLVGLRLSSSSPKDLRKLSKILVDYCSLGSLNCFLSVNTFVTSKRLDEPEESFWTQIRPVVVSKYFEVLSLTSSKDNTSTGVDVGKLLLLCTQVECSDLLLLLVSRVLRVAPTEELVEEQSMVLLSLMVEQSLKSLTINSRISSDYICTLVSSYVSLASLKFLEYSKYTCFIVFRTLTNVLIADIFVLNDSLSWSSPISYMRRNSESGGNQPSPNSMASEVSKESKDSVVSLSPQQADTRLMDYNQYLSMISSLEQSIRPKSKSHRDSIQNQNSRRSITLNRRIIDSTTRDVDKTKATSPDDVFGQGSGCGDCGLKSQSTKSNTLHQDESAGISSPVVNNSVGHSRTDKRGCRSTRDIMAANTSMLLMEMSFGVALVYLYTNAVIDDNTLVCSFDTLINDHYQGTSTDFEFADIQKADYFTIPRYIVWLNLVVTVLEDESFIVLDIPYQRLRVQQLISTLTNITICYSFKKPVMPKDKQNNLIECLLDIIPINIELFDRFLLQHLKSERRLAVFSQSVRGTVLNNSCGLVPNLVSYLCCVFLRSNICLNTKHSYSDNPQYEEGEEECKFNLRLKMKQREYLDKLWFILESYSDYAMHLPLLITSVLVLMGATNDVPTHIIHYSHSGHSGFVKSIKVATLVISENYQDDLYRFIFDVFCDSFININNHVVSELMLNVVLDVIGRYFNADDKEGLRSCDHFGGPATAYRNNLANRQPEESIIRFLLFYALTGTKGNVMRLVDDKRFFRFITRHETSFMNMKTHLAYAILSRKGDIGVFSSEFYSNLFFRPFPHIVELISIYDVAGTHPLTVAFRAWARFRGSVVPSRSLFKDILNCSKSHMDGDKGDEGNRGFSGYRVQPILPLECLRNMDGKRLGERALDVAKFALEIFTPSLKAVEALSCCLRGTKYRELSRRRISSVVLVLVDWMEKTFSYKKKTSSKDESQSFNNTIDWRIGGKVDEKGEERRLDLAMARTVQPLFVLFAILVKLGYIDELLRTNIGKRSKSFAGIHQTNSNNKKEKKLNTANKDKAKRTQRLVPLNELVGADITGLSVIFFLVDTVNHMIDSSTPCEVWNLDMEDNESHPITPHMFLLRRIVTPRFLPLIRSIGIERISDCVIHVCKNCERQLRIRHVHRGFALIGGPITNSTPRNWDTALIGEALEADKQPPRHYYFALAALQRLSVDDSDTMHKAVKYIFGRGLLPRVGIPRALWNNWEGEEMEKTSSDNEEEVTTGMYEDIHLIAPPTPLPARVLSLDGGGSKGICELAAVRRLEIFTGLTPSCMFDVIAGTSIGAYLGALLGTGMLCIPALHMFPRVAASLFKNTLVRMAVRVVMSRGMGRYSRGTLKDALLFSFGDRIMKEDGPQTLIASSQQNNPPGVLFPIKEVLFPAKPCIVIVGATHGGRRPFISTTHPLAHQDTIMGASRRSDQPSKTGQELDPIFTQNVLYRDACLGSAAATTYFSPVVIRGCRETGAIYNTNNDRQCSYVTRDEGLRVIDTANTDSYFGIEVEDGGVGYNNPSIIAIQTSLDVAWTTDRRYRAMAGPQRSIGYLVSLGCGPGSLPPRRPIKSQSQQEGDPEQVPSAGPAAINPNPVTYRGATDDEQRHHRALLSIRGLISTLMPLLMRFLYSVTSFEKNDMLARMLSASGQSSFKYMRIAPLTTGVRKTQKVLGPLGIDQSPPTPKEGEGMKPLDNGSVVLNCGDLERMESLRLAVDEEFRGWRIPQHTISSSSSGHRSRLHTMIGSHHHRHRKSLSNDTDSNRTKSNSVDSSSLDNRSHREQERIGKNSALTEDGIQEAKKQWHDMWLAEGVDVPNWDRVFREASRRIIAGVFYVDGVWMESPTFSSHKQSACSEEAETPLSVSSPMYNTYTTNTTTTITTTITTSPSQSLLSCNPEPLPTSTIHSTSYNRHHTTKKLKRKTVYRIRVFSKAGAVCHRGPSVFEPTAIHRNPVDTLGSITDDEVKERERIWREEGYSDVQEEGNMVERLFANPRFVLHSRDIVTLKVPDGVDVASFTPPDDNGGRKDQPYLQPRLFYSVERVYDKPWVVLIRFCAEHERVLTAARATGGLCTTLLLSVEDDNDGESFTVGGMPGPVVLREWGKTDRK